MSNDPITANKGEWSELFVFFKLLAEGEVYGADEDLERLDEIVFPIHHIERGENKGLSIYDLMDREGSVVIKNEKGEKIAEVSVKSIDAELDHIFSELRDSSGRAFTLTTALPLMEDLHCESVKAGSRKKGDLVLMIHDLNTQSMVKEGFSVKSLVGGEATLLNASGATNFVYKVENFNPRNIDEVNGISGRSKIKKRLEKLQELGGGLVFEKVESKIFEGNLKKVDTLMPQIISELLIEYYSMRGGGMNQLLEKWSEKERFYNPLLNEFELNAGDLEHKLKNLLMNSALGMLPNTPWDGYLEAAGGFLVLREDGEVVCYHVYNLDQLRAYLFNNAKLETASSGRHGFAEIYEQDGELYFNLNLQIRFSH